MAYQGKICGMIIVTGPDDQADCGGRAVAEVEGGPVCAKCRDGAKEEGLEMLPLGTEMIYSTGRAAFDHAKQFDCNSQADCVIKAVAAMIAYNERAKRWNS